MSAENNRNKKRIGFDFWRKSKNGEDGEYLYEDSSESKSLNSSIVKDSEYDRKKNAPVVEIPVNEKLLTKTLSTSDKKIRNIVKKLNAAEKDIMNENESEISSYDEDEEFSNEEFEMYLNRLKTENPAEYEIIMKSIRDEDLANLDHETIIAYQMESPIYETVDEKEEFRKSGMMSPVENKEISLSEQLGMQNIPMIKKRYRISKAKKEEDKKDQEKLYEMNRNINEIRKNTTDKINTIKTFKESYNLLSPPSSPLIQKQSKNKLQPTKSHKFILDTNGDNDIQLDSNVNTEEIDEDLLKQIQSNFENGNKSFVATTTTTTTTSDVPENNDDNETVVKKRIPIITKDGKKAYIEVVEKTVVTTITSEVEGESEGEEQEEIIEEIIEEEEEEEEEKEMEMEMEMRKTNIIY